MLDSLGWSPTQHDVLLQDRIRQMRTSSCLFNPSRRLNAEVQQVNAHLQAAGAEGQRAAEESQELHAANDR